MDQEVLQALSSALELVSEAQVGIEGEAALLRGVNADLSSTLRRLRPRARSATTGEQQQQQLPQADQQLEAQDVRRSHALGSPPAAASRGQAHTRPSIGSKARPSQQQQQQQQRLGSSRQSVRGSHAQPGTGPSAPRPGARTPQLQQQADSGSTGQLQQLQLPPDFRQLLRQYGTLAQQLGGTDAAGQPAAASSVAAAAAGFTRQLAAAYGPSLQAVQQQADQQQQQQLLPGAPAQQPAVHTWLEPAAFAAQARFLGLVAAALWAVQKLQALPARQPHGPSREQRQLEQLVPALLAECQQWLAGAAHGQQQQEAHAAQQAAAAEDAALWRNRCLRTLLAGAGAAADGAGSAGPAGSRSSGAPAAAQPPGIWLPQACWQQLSPSGGSAPGGAWQSLLPGPHGAGRAASRGAAASTSRGLLCYAQPSEMLQHARQLQRLQQLLLQLAVEAEAAPPLLELLLRGCAEADAMAAAARQGRTDAAAGSRALHERCCALYRLVCALAAGPVKQRGLGPSCQLVEEVEVADAALIDWD